MGLFDFWKKSYESISPAVAQERINAGAMLLDVRESNEYRAAHAPSAKLISLGVLSKRLKELPLEREILVICASGVRSSQAASMLAKEGFRVTNISGGMASWQRAGLRTVKK
jgi:rhodanese-related sulfurtransferase